MVTKYLLDTNICIFYMKDVPQVSERMRSVAVKDLAISEVTPTELKYGIAKSERPFQNRASLDRFVTGVTVLPIRDVLDTFAFEKARLTRTGTPLPDFDLPIGATAIVHNLTLVTNNTKHFQRLKGIKLADWTR
jgi:tRNA(fMet)-specific endonuclease VapC